MKKSNTAIEIAPETRATNDTATVETVNTAALFVPAVEDLTPEEEALFAALTAKRAAKSNAVAARVAAIRAQIAELNAELIALGGIKTATKTTTGCAVCGKGRHRGDESKKCLGYKMFENAA